MCIAIPSRVVAVDGHVASVECYGVRREVSLLFHPETTVGEYVVVQTGHVVERLDEQTAREALALFDTILASDQGAADPGPSS
jgi:hydrogenase expression/formation protein HypC